MRITGKRNLFKLILMGLILLSCKLTNLNNLTNPISGLADAISNMFESIAKSITINF